MPPREMLERSIPKQLAILLQVRQIMVLPSRKWMHTGCLLHVLCLREDLKYIIFTEAMLPKKAAVYSFPTQSLGPG